MPLDLGETALQLEMAARQMGRSQGDREERLAAFLQAVGQVDPDAAQSRTQYTPGRPFLAAQVEVSLLGSHGPTEIPPDWSVLAVDGSHIDVDRHLPVGCYLINLGGCSLTYGADPDAQLFSRPHLAWQPDELYLADPQNPAHEEPITGSVLGMYRTVQELERLAEAVEERPPGMPILALVDGSLVMWGLSGQGYQSFVRDAIVQDRLMKALDRFADLALDRQVTLAAYVSLPRSTEVVNAAKVCLCPHPISLCSDSRNGCGNRRSMQAPCDLANGFLDRDLFRTLLPAGSRSPVYLTNSSVSRQHYSERQQVHFYYLNVGEEIARVEVPRWVAQDETLLALGHSLILDQCRRGQGYPVAISEAHEQAVLNGNDRQIFKDLLARSLEDLGLPNYTSEKERSKRTPWL